MARHERDYIIGLDLGIASVGWACVEVAVTEKDGKEHAQPIGLIVRNPRVIYTWG